MPDNKVFNVNGRSKEQLKLTLQLALMTEYGKSTPEYEKVKGWKFSKKHGLILLWHADEKAATFPVELTYETVTEIVWQWLSSDEAKTCEMKGWDGDADHDGHNELGWRVYCEDWGHVDSNHYAIVAVKPAYCWYGK